MKRDSESSLPWSFSLDKVPFPHSYSGFSIVPQIARMGRSLRDPVREGAKVVRTDWQISASGDRSPC
jgi:hypothetical protein